MNIAASDAYSFDIVEHEYGRYVADAEFFGKADLDHTPGVNLRYYKQDATSLPAGKAAGDETAFEEGFADFFSIFAQQETNAAKLGILDVGDGTDDTLSYDPVAKTVTRGNVYDYLKGVATEVTGATAKLGVGEDDEASTAGSSSRCSGLSGARRRVHWPEHRAV